MPATGSWWRRAPSSAPRCPPRPPPVRRGEGGEEGAPRVNLVAARPPGRRVPEQQPAAADRQLGPLRWVGEPLRQRRIDAGPGAGAGAVRAEEALLVIADDHLRLALLQEAHDLVREAVLVNAVAQADDILEITHQGQRLGQCCPVA